MHVGYFRLRLHRHGLGRSPGVSIGVTAMDKRGDDFASDIVSMEFPHEQGTSFSLLISS